VLMFANIRKEDRPREKLKKYGSRRLTDGELTQILIGSGIAGHSLGRIARAVLRIIRNNNAELTYAQLQSVPGMGPARIAQILSTFELASRYPIHRKGSLLDSFESITAYLSRDIHTQSVTVITTDGAGYAINKRVRPFVASSDRGMSIRYIVSDVCTDNAEGVILIVHTRDSSISPTMVGLQVARELRYIGAILHVRLRDVIIENKGTYRSVLEKDE